MNLNLLSDWLPIILIGLAATVIVLGLAKFLNKNVLYTITSILCLVCFALIIISVVVVGGWEGMGMGIVTIAIFLGISLGVVISPVVKNK